MHPGDRLKETTIPWRGTYWVEPGLFLAGNFPGDMQVSKTRERISLLLDAGIRCFINLMSDDETGEGPGKLPCYRPHLAELASARKIDFTYKQFPIGDFDTPATNLMGQLVDFLEKNLKKKRPVYLHCWAGRGRTGLVVSCYLKHFRKLSAEEALKSLQMLRKAADAPGPSPETSSQFQFISYWER
jgi:hypothetical protein